MSFVHTRRHGHSQIPVIKEQGVIEKSVDERLEETEDSINEYDDMYGGDEELEYTGDEINGF